MSSLFNYDKLEVEFMTITELNENKTYIFPSIENILYIYNLYFNE